MLQSTSEYEERNFDDIQRALDIEHTVKALEAQLCPTFARRSCPTDSKGSVQILRCRLVWSYPSRFGLENLDTVLVV